MSNLRDIKIQQQTAKLISQVLKSEIIYSDRRFVLMLKVINGSTIRHQTLGFYKLLLGSSTACSFYQQLFSDVPNFWHGSQAFLIQFWETAIFQQKLVGVAYHHSFQTTMALCMVVSFCYQLAIWGSLYNSNLDIPCVWLPQAILITKYCRIHSMYCISHNLR